MSPTYANGHTPEEVWAISKEEKWAAKETQDASVTPNSETWPGVFYYPPPKVY